MTIDSPPIELIEEWRHEPEFAEPGLTTIYTMSEKQLKHIATKAAQWGFNQHQPVTDAQLQEVRDEELEACVEWVANTGLLGTAKSLRTARRSKPPSLKEEGLGLLERIRKGETVWNLNELEIFDRILEALPND